MWVTRDPPSLKLRGTKEVKKWSNRLKPAETYTHTHTHTCKGLLSPKQIGTICLVFSFIFISQKSYSENIPSNPTSDNSTLGVYSGSAALEPDWGANEIPLRWYNNNTLMDVTAAESTCEYDSTIDVATAPSRTGYNFSGWTVRPERSFSELKTASYTTGQKRWAKGEVYSTHADYCYVAANADSATNVPCNSDSNFFELQQYEWKVESTKGTIYGMAYCSGKTGDNHSWAWGGDSSDWKATKEELISATGSKQQCWCLATGWIPTGEQTMYSPLASLSWVFAHDYGSASSCSTNCAHACSYDVRRNSGFRAALFTPATNNQ